MSTVNQNPAFNQAPAKAKEEPIGDSSFIAKIKYDPAQLALTVETKSGNEYVHFMVYPATYEQFMLAPSKGRFYNQVIRGKGLSTKIISHDTGPQPRNPARGPIKKTSGGTHGR